MLIKFDNLLRKIANWKIVLDLFVISFPIGYYIERPLFYMIGQPDYYYAYSANDLYGYLLNFDSMGLLREYLTYQQTFQVFFPLITALFFISFIYNTGNGLVPKKILIPFAIIIPTTTLLIDYLENMGLIILIRSYQKMSFASFAPRLRNIAEITSNFAPIKGFLWDMESLVFFAGIAIYIFKIIRFFLNKTGILVTFKRKISYALLVSSTNSDDTDKKIENNLKEKTNVMQTKAQVLSMTDARENILALVGVIGWIGILVFVVFFLRSISPYPVQ